VKVSVIIPVYNGATYLAAALESVLAQTHPVHEIIAIDDGSTDSSPEILRSFGTRLRTVRQPNRGVAAARNEGLAQASGDLICFLDQDDLWPADRTRVIVEALRENPEAELATGLVQILYQRAAPPDAAALLGVMHREWLLGSLCVRAEVFRELGPFNTGMGYADDTDFWMRRVEAGTRNLYLEQVTLIYRLHCGNTSIDDTVSRFHLMAAIRESLKRKRRGHEHKLRHSRP
jgi:glycosyltransferase involved in cell wall biosynthesis